jgi:hypothetical protein
VTSPMINSLVKSMQTTVNKESVNMALAMHPRPDDIFIATFPKSGTTWLQQILYQMASGGRMDFNEISNVVPWVERAHFLGQDVEKMPSPRIFKSHLTYESIPKGPCKYICVLRDGRDVSIAYYDFIMARYGDGENIPFEEFFMDFFLPGDPMHGNWFTHLKGWWKHRHDDNVLIMTYEDMKDDLARAVDAIAEFSGFALDSELRRTVIEHSSFEFMKRHEGQFSETVVVHTKIPAGRVTKVRAGEVGAHRARMTPELNAAYGAEFENQMAEIGIARYEDFRAALRS